MDRLLTGVLGVGLLCGILIYPTYRTWLIAKKGYDADRFSWGYFCGVFSFGGFLLVDGNTFLGLVVIIALVVVGALLRMNKIGIVHGLIITFMQGFSLPGRFLMFAGPLIWAGLHGVEYRGRKTNADISEARAWETYQQRRSNAEDYSGVTKAESQYKEDIAAIKIAHGEVANDK